MATLTETAAGTKKLIKISAIGVVIFLIFNLGLFVFNTYLKVVKPPPPPTADGQLWKITGINIPGKTAPGINFKTGNADRRNAKSGW